MNWPKLITCFLLVVCSWSLFWFLDRLAEKHKERGLGTRARWGGSLVSEADQYWAYTWMRYVMSSLLSIGLAGIGLEAVLGNERRVYSEDRFSIFLAVVIALSTLFFAVDQYWERQKQRDWDRNRERLFRIYWRLRYPFLSLVATWGAKFTYFSAR